MAVYVGFSGLLRGCEILDLSMSDVQPRGPDQVFLILRDTKGARLRNVRFEMVTLRDPLVIKILLKRKVNGGPMLFNGKSPASLNYIERLLIFIICPTPSRHLMVFGGGGS